MVKAEASSTMSKLKNHRYLNYFSRALGSMQVLWFWEANNQSTSSGYINYFLLADSLSARPFLDSVLVNPEHTIFKIETRKFYNGENFIKIARLPFIEQLIQAELDEEKAKEEKDNEEKEQKESEEIKPSQEIPEEKEKEPDKKSPKEGKD